MDDFSKSPLRLCAWCSFSLVGRFRPVPSFSDVHFATLTRDPVYSRSVAGVRFILVCVEKSLKFVGTEW